MQPKSSGSLVAEDKEENLLDSKMNQSLFVMLLAIMFLGNCLAFPQFYPGFGFGPGGTGAGAGTGSAGFGGVSASGIGISSATHGGIGFGTGRGSGYSGGLFGGHYATGDGNGFSFGK